MLPNVPNLIKFGGIANHNQQNERLKYSSSAVIPFKNIVILLSGDRNMQANFGVGAFRQPGAVTAAGVVTPVGYPAVGGAANRRFIAAAGAGLGVPNKGPPLRRFAKGDLQATGSSSLG